MKQFHFTYTFSPIPKFMQKGRQVMIVLQNNKGQFILGTKNKYPPNIYRFVGGGVDGKEDWEEAAVRELEEEVDIKIDKKELQPLAFFTVEVTDNLESCHFEMMLYKLMIDNQSELIPSSDLDGLVTLSKEEILQLEEHYKHLSPALVDLGGNKPGPFRWSDYGTFMSEVHKIAIKLV